MAAGVRGITKASSGRLSPKNEPGTDVFQDLGGLRAAVGGEVVQYHYAALVEGRGQLGFDIKVEEFSVHRPADHPRRVQPVMAQGRDEGLSVPVSERSVINQTCPALGPTGRLGHVDLQGPSAGVSIPRIDPFSRFDVNEYQSCQHVAHEGLAATDPYRAGRCDVGPLLPGGPQVFFVCQAEAAQMPPNRDAVGVDALDFPKFDHQLIEGQAALFPDRA